MVVLLSPYGLRRRQAKKHLFQRIAKLQKKVSQYDPKEVQAAIDEAVRVAQQSQHS